MATMATPLCIAHMFTTDTLKKQSLKYNVVKGSLSMNGCNGDPRAPLGTIETRTFPVAPTPALAADQLGSAIYELKSNPPQYDSGIIRIEVPIQEKMESLNWLRSQNDGNLIPRTYFSGRDSGAVSISEHNLNANKNDHKKKLVSVAGLGSAVLFRDHNPTGIPSKGNRKFLSKNSPLIRAYGAIRFDPKSSISSEWKDFGCFFFTIPQIEFNEFKGSSMIAATVAWDNKLSKTYKQAISALEATLWRVSWAIDTSENYSTDSIVLLHNTEIPDRPSWDSAVNNALDLIQKKDWPLIKVVLARCNRILTCTEINPLELLNRLQLEGYNSFQFCVQPPEAPAFIGNTPERLFCRDGLTVFSEALAATRARGLTESQDLQIGFDLLTSPKDDHEFAVVRETIKKKLESVCTNTKVQPRKALRKLTRVQHLYARLTGTLEKEGDEFKLLSCLHPTPAVCGLPTEQARVLISETELFDRGMYAGPVGWFSGAESEFAVGIRSALVGEGGAMLYAGTGIVNGSVPSLEWQELELKTSQFIKLMKAEETIMPMEEDNCDGLQRGTGNDDLPDERLQTSSLDLIKEGTNNIIVSGETSAVGPELDD